MAERRHFSADDMITVLRGDGLNHFLSQHLSNFKLFHALERNVQAYIFHYIVHTCFTHEDAEYNHRFINVECPEVELTDGTNKTPDLCLKAEYSKNVIELWVEIKSFVQSFGSFNSSTVSRDFDQMSKLPTSVKKKMMLIIGDGGLHGHVNEISSITKEYPEILHEVIILE